MKFLLLFWNLQTAIHEFAVGWSRNGPRKTCERMKS